MPRRGGVLTMLQNSENSLSQWAASVAALFVSSGEKSGALAEMIRENYTHEGIAAAAAALIARTDAKTSGDARIKGFSTSVSRAVPRVLDADGKPTKIAACAVLAVSFKLAKSLERGSGKVSKHLTARVIEKEKSERDATKECVNAVVGALLNGWAAGADDDTIEALRNAVSAVLNAVKCNYLPCDDMTDDARANLIAKMDNALSQTDTSAE